MRIVELFALHHIGKFVCQFQRLFDWSSPLIASVIIEADDMLMEQPSPKTSLLSLAVFDLQVQSEMLSPQVGLFRFTMSPSDSSSVAAVARLLVMIHNDAAV